MIIFFATLLIVYLFGFDVLHKNQASICAQIGPQAYLKVRVSEKDEANDKTLVEDMVNKGCDF